MPIYAFECEKCGHQFDRLQKLSAPDPETCPQCSQNAIKRQVTAPYFRLAGSGWYETDFKGDSDKKRNLVDDSPNSSPKAENKSQTPPSPPPATTPKTEAPAAKTTPTKSTD